MSNQSARYLAAVCNPSRASRPPRTFLTFIGALPKTPPTPHKVQPFEGARVLHSDPSVPFRHALAKRFKSFEGTPSLMHTHSSLPLYCLAAIAPVRARPPNLLSRARVIIHPAPAPSPSPAPPALPIISSDTSESTDPCRALRIGEGDSDRRCCPDRPRRLMQATAV